MRVLELFSGIGGWHFAVKECGVNAQVVAAVDVNTVANTVYCHNFPNTKLCQRNIQSLTVDELNTISPNVIAMSPPCQPFTRVGLKKDVEDDRTSALLHLINILPQLDIHFKYLLVENVKGFETSDARCQLIKCLQHMSFTYQEFILCPTQIGVPNSRSRYYLIGKRSPLQFAFPISSDLMNKLPDIAVINKFFDIAPDMTCSTLDEVIGFDDGKFAANEGVLISDSVLEKRGKLMDIVTKDSKRSCCFTKAYGHYVEGTGSVYSPLTEQKVASIRNRIEAGDGGLLDNMKQFELRYFTPKEISLLMNFPAEFSFPSSTTRKQKYRLLGNSINVKVVTILLRILIYNDEVS